MVVPLPLLYRCLNVNAMGLIMNSATRLSRTLETLLATKSERSTDVLSRKLTMVTVGPAFGISRPPTNGNRPFSITLTMSGRTEFMTAFIGTPVRFEMFRTTTAMVGLVAKNRTFMVLCLDLLLNLFTTFAQSVTP